MTRFSITDLSLVGLKLIERKRLGDARGYLSRLFCRDELAAAGGEGVPLKALVYNIADQLGRRDLVKLGAIPTRVNEPATLIADAGRLRDEVGFRPSYNLENGISLTIESIKKVVNAR